MGGGEDEDQYPVDGRLASIIDAVEEKRAIDPGRQLGDSESTEKLDKSAMRAFKPILAETDIPGGYENKSRLKHCFALVDFIAGDHRSDIALIKGARTNGISEPALVQAALNVEKVCSEKKSL